MDGDRDRTRTFYDELGEGEWSRMTATIAARVSLEVHRRFLRRYVANGAEVLEIGAGPGRFTLELAELGATVDVSDLSEVQLALNVAHVGAAGAEGAVRSRRLLDVCDTTALPGESYDVVLAYGGPLSYAFEQIDDALSGLHRVLRPGGVLVASVMSLLGSWRHFLEGVIEEASEIGEDANDVIFETGDLRGSIAPHKCQMFRSRDVPVLLARSGLELVEMSASNWASLTDAPSLGLIEADADRWSRFLDHEVAACKEHGALDGGTHLLFCARRPRN